MTTINVVNCKFEALAYFNVANLLRGEPGVFVIVDNRDGDIVLIDADEGENLWEDIQYHDRKGIWEKEEIGKLVCGVLYEQDPNERRTLMQNIRLKYPFLPTSHV